MLNKEGYNVTQATVSRDIRQLKLVKKNTNGRHIYSVYQNHTSVNVSKNISILKEGFVSMAMAQNILVIKTGVGLAMAVAATLDAMQWDEIVGCIAGDDTIMCAISSVDDTIIVMDNGRIDAIGTHKELLKTNEIYKEVYESQTKGGLE